MTYAFHTPDKLCFILDLMNGGDLHYHLSQHGVFNEHEMKFYAAEVILGEFRIAQYAVTYITVCLNEIAPVVIFWVVILCNLLQVDTTYVTFW